MYYNNDVSLCSNLDKLIKPSSVKVISDDSSEKSDIVLEPLESGFALTLGNALRRVMLSSLKGSAVYGIKIEGVTHEFTSIQGVREDVTDIVLNMGMLRCKLNGASNKCLNLNAKGPCQVLAGMIETDDRSFNSLVVTPTFTYGAMKSRVSAASLPALCINSKSSCECIVMFIFSMSYCNWYAYLQVHKCNNFTYYENKSYGS